MSVLYSAYTRNQELFPSVTPSECDLLAPRLPSLHALTPLFNLPGLDMLARLSQVEHNEELISDHLPAEMYVDVVRLLTVQDIHMIVSTLEALYQLSEIGEVPATQIAMVTRCVGEWGWQCQHCMTCREGQNLSSWEDDSMPCREVGLPGNSITNSVLSAWIVFPRKIEICSSTTCIPILVTSPANHKHFAMGNVSSSDQMQNFWPWKYFHVWWDAPHKEVLDISSVILSGLTCMVGFCSWGIVGSALSVECTSGCLHHCPSHQF